MTLLVIIIVLALIFDYINGFHDAANSIATIVSTKVLTPFQAVLWAALFNFIAFFIFKDHGVANTIAKTVKESYITLQVILAGLSAAIIWNLLTWWFGIPSSSSHTLIGGFAGAAIAHAGFESINITPVLQIVAFILLAPLIGMIMAFIISLWFINSFRKSIWPKVFSLCILFAVGIVLYKTMEFDPAKLSSHYNSYILKVIFHSHNFKMVLMGFIMTVMCIFTLYLSRLNAHKSTVWFKRLQLVSSAAFSIGHGGNDAQKVMGIITVALIAHGNIQEFEQMPTWVPISCYTAIALGTLSGGWKIVKTMGSRITKVTPFEGVAAETAGAITLFLTEHLKIPVSTTHTIAGSIMGVGATKRLSAVRWGVTVNLLWAWIITIPISALMAGLIYYIFHFFF
ncbi:inorganic phosphate transporter [Terrimonas sp.]|uniref:inorganic phosphate transporter n=1 Tax=Terrimonas sp. TaxID=1914338 RepID=UPI000928CB3D|nr:inorganic phosphate transporter [Terrimonas sp.]OJY92911.1 MAG: inorganic phosphate transporter [Sphingobacteriales bacterium 40-81]PVD54227.1 inorganic phosphate transporter [Terrimonas sp.]